MGILFNRLLNLLNSEDPQSTYYHIAFIMLQHTCQLQNLSINELSELCCVSKSTISKFIRHIGYEDYAEYRYAAVIEYNKYNLEQTYVRNVMEYLDAHSPDSYMLAVYQDISATWKNLDWDAVDRLVRDLAAYKRVGAFGLMFSETAAINLQIKLAKTQKYVFTNLNDLEQDSFIREAGPDTLIIVFSNSGEYLNRYQRIEDFTDKHSFSKTRAKIVVITSNKKVASDPRVSYCIFFEQTSALTTHHIMYQILTDMIAYRYWEYIRRLS